jgi:hypothetical protein
MFCALNGATRTLWLRNQAQNAVAIHDFPAPEDVPRMPSAFTVVLNFWRQNEFSNEAERAEFMWNSGKQEPILFAQGIFQLS